MAKRTSMPDILSGDTDEKENKSKGKTDSDKSVMDNLLKDDVKDAATGSTEKEDKTKATPKKVEKVAPVADEKPPEDETAPEKEEASADTAVVEVEAEVVTEAVEGVAVSVVSENDAALAIVKKYMAWSAGAGAIPMPVIDLAAITGVQLKMLKKLSNHYGVAFHAHLGKSALAALVGGYGAGTLAFGTAGTMLKSIPGIGSLLGIAALPGFASATTYAVGRVFIQHFASGGTFLSFDPDKSRAHFDQYFKDQS